MNVQTQALMNDTANRFRALSLKYGKPMIFLNDLERRRAAYRQAVRTGDKARIQDASKRLGYAVRAAYYQAWKDVRTGNPSTDSPLHDEALLCLRSRHKSRFIGLVMLPVYHNQQYTYNWTRKGVRVWVHDEGITLIKDHTPIGQFPRVHILGMFKEISKIKRLMEGLLPDKE